MMKPKISIITPSYNQGQFLEETILSVINQNYSNLEYIIIDGGSNDNSVEIVRRYQNRLKYWISEKDFGQTHAINKGLKKSTGELINWVNSDDLLEPNALNIISEEIVKSPKADIYFGDFRKINSKSQTIFIRKSPPYHYSTLLWGRQLSSQPAVFIRRKLFENLGFLDEKLNFCMDIEFWIRVANHGARFKQINSIIGVTRSHKKTKTKNLQHILHNEHKNILRNYVSMNNVPVNSRTEEYYFKALNRFWRGVASINRMIYRRDFSFLKNNRAFNAQIRE